MTRRTRRKEDDDEEAETAEIGLSKGTSTSTERDRKDMRSGKKVKHLIKYLTRPEWRKTFRCAGHEESTCEECSGEQDCFFQDQADSGKGGMLRVDVPDPPVGQSVAFIRFYTLIHVRCRDEIDFGLRIQSIANGLASVFVDGNEVTQAPKSGAIQFPEDQEHQYSFWQLKLAPDKNGGGGHTFKLEFKLAGGVHAGGSVSVNFFNIYMPVDYANCEDGKACLAALVQGNDITEGLKFRNSNAAQKSCLDSTNRKGKLVKRLAKTSLRAEFHVVCETWARCLAEVPKKDSKKAAIQKLLRAAAVPSDLEALMLEQGAEEASKPLKQVIQLNEEKQSSEKDLRVIDLDEGIADDRCINPETEDPEAWACDCWENMLQRCVKLEYIAGYDQDVCIRSQFCYDPRVCTSWKEPDSRCSDDIIQTYVVELQALAKREADEEAKKEELLLLQRRDAEHGERQYPNVHMSFDFGGGMNNAFASKQCV